MLWRSAEQDADGGEELLHLLVQLRQKARVEPRDLQYLGRRRGDAPGIARVRQVCGKYDVDTPGRSVDDHSGPAVEADLQPHLFADLAGHRVDRLLAATQHATGKAPSRAIRVPEQQH